jgi:hypothetical protein
MQYVFTLGLASQETRLDLKEMHDKPIRSPGAITSYTDFDAGGFA